jgi:rubredoxin
MGTFAAGRAITRVDEEKGYAMLDPTRFESLEAGGYVEFLSTGDAAKGEYHCSECGYGVTVHRELPRCPMCSGTTWEQVPWSPFTRARLQ